MKNNKSDTPNLEITHPELASEWHPTKNGTLLPKDVTKGTTLSVWWLGKCGHEWQVSINSRTNKKTGCPYCTGNKVLVGFNDLNSQNPGLAMEWHPIKNGSLKPTDMMVGSRKKVWWLGKCGHEWESAVYTRSQLGYGCPYCSNKKLLVGFNDLATTHADIAREWHPYKNGELHPTDVITGTHKKIWWKCAVCGNEWKTTLNSRLDGKGCPKCAKKRGAEKRRIQLVQSKGSLKAVNPVLANEWNYERNGELTPNDITLGYNGVIWWKGTCGHEWTANIRDRNKGIGCPYCSNKKLLVGFNDLETKRPDIAKEWNYSKNKSTPSNILAGSGKSVWWKCQVCGHEWRAKVITRVRGSGCPKCASEKSTSYPEQAIYFYLKGAFPDAINRYVLDGYELDIFLPSICLGVEYDGDYYHPQEKRTQENKKRDFFLSRGIDLVRIKESDTVKQSEGEVLYYCPKSGYSSLDEVIERLVKLITEKYSKDTVVDINNKRDMINIMSSYVSGIKSNSVAAIKPELVQEWNYDKNGELQPSFISANSNKKVWWKCKNNHVWTATIYSRTQGASCPYCTNKLAWAGFNDLATTNPELSLEWNDYRNGALKPTDVLAGSSKKVWWKCRVCGHEWSAIIQNRSRGSRCPECTKLKKR